MAAVAEGPVSVAIDSSRLGWYFRGIIKKYCKDDLDHAVLVVGYGTEKDIPYWIVKNSYGSTWGEKGYFRVMRDMTEGEEGLCGITLMAVYPEL